MSKYIIAGEPIKLFIKRTGLGCWLVETQTDANKLQRMIGSYARRAGIKHLKYKSMPCIKDNSIVNICVTVEKVRNK